MRYLALDESLRIIERRGWGPVRDVGLLDSALARPRSSAFGEDAYPTLELKAAALLHSLAGNHALVDGNKRTALHLTRLFLVLNGWDMDLTQDEKVELILDVATGQSDLGKIVAAMRLRPTAAP